jgi:tetratricopeptide (TPR) repeat protein
MCSRRLKAWILVLPLLVVLAGAWGSAWSGRLEASSGSKSTREDQPQWAGRGGLALLANLSWLRAYVAWEREDAGAMAAWLQLTVQLDPRPLPFWINGARMLAYDVPEWRIRNEGGHDRVPAGVRERWRAEQAEVALRHLERACQVHRDHPEIWVEIANLKLNRQGDVAAAIAAYARAAQQPTAPPYVARVQAELLRRAGRREEAWAVLVREHPRLQLMNSPRERERAMPEVVLARIRELEAELGMEAERRYRP